MQLMGLIVHVFKYYDIQKHVLCIKIKILISLLSDDVLEIELRLKTMS